MFISFEGGEGCGKSTQAKLLKEYMLSLGESVILTREPGGTDFAEELRKLLLNGKGINDPLTEFLLINTARRDHVINLVNKSLELNQVVISDRFFDSSYVYQGFVKGLPLSLIKEITKLSIGDFEPNITFLLDLDPIVSLGRVRNNNRGEENYYDKKGLSFHMKVREGFLMIAKEFNKRIKIINADQTQEKVFSDILAVLKNSSY
jgi:dTMP kinase